MGKNLSPRRIEATGNARRDGRRPPVGGICRSLGLGSLLLSLLLTGCIGSGVAPLPVLDYGGTEGRGHHNLLVLLRGMGADHHIFEDEGIIAEIRRRNLPFDVIAPDAHFGYYQARTLGQRLQQDIVEPYRRRGYRQIWLAGFSMGGMGSLLYLRDFPREVDGVILTSPYLGWDGIVHEIKRAGGVRAWQGMAPDTDDWQRLLWSWIKRYGEDPGRYPPVYLGFGQDDWVADEGPPLLATVLPPERVFSVPGNHTIGTLKRLFLLHLDRLGPLFLTLDDTPVSPPPLLLSAPAPAALR